jgi:endonuclease-3
VRRQDKADRIGAILDELYPEPAIPLDHVDPFTLLVAVVLSAQTTDKKVNEVSPDLFAVAPTPEAMARLEVSEIQRIIRQIGLAPQKAKALRGLSEILVAEHGGQVPRTFEALEALPGVGHKTASVVMVQAFHQPAFPVDTHIHRLAARWGLSSGKSVEQTERDLKRLFPEDTWSRRHLQIIYFGREHCPALRHDLTTCPICSWAASAKRIREEAQPQARPAGRPRRASR